MDTPTKTITVSFLQNCGMHMLHRLFSAGWETLEPTRYAECCGIYYTTLYFPDVASENDQAQGPAAQNKP